MSLLNTMKGGVKPRPQRVVIYAPEGLGKTTLASQFPHPLFFDFEGGTHHIDVVRVEPKTLEETETTLIEISKKGPKALGFQTVVIDTIDWLENLVVESVCREAKKDSIEDFGYGKGYTHVSERMLKLLGLLDAVKDAGFHVVLLAHSEIKKFELPDAAGQFDRYQLKLDKRNEPLVKEWADALLFGNWKTQVAEKDGAKDRLVGGKTRVLYCNRTAAYDAKNRFGLKDEEAWGIATLSKGFAAIGAPWDKPAAPASNGTQEKPATGVNPLPGETKVTAVATPAQKPVPRDQEPDADEIPGVPSPEIAKLDTLLKGDVDAVNSFLIARREIAEGQSYADVSPAYRSRILRKPAEFLKAARAHGAPVPAHA
jgi:hypothetical protein